MQPSTLLILLALALQACGGGETESPVAGPCVHSYLEPIVLLDSVTVAGASDVLGSITLDNISIDGRPADLNAVASTLKNIQVNGQSLICTTPCGLGNVTGAYLFRAQSAGFKPIEVSVAAKYASFAGGCPSSNSGGTHVIVTLERL